MASQDFPLNLQANIPVDISTIAGSNFIALIEATQKVQVKFGVEDYQDLLLGDVLEDQSFDRVFVKSTIAQAVTLKAGRGRYRPKSDVTVSSVNSTIEPSNTVTNIADTVVGSSQVVIASATTRKEVIINVPASAANAVRIGASGVTASSGLKVEPGSTLTLAFEGALYAIRDGSSDVTVNGILMSRP